MPRASAAAPTERGVKTGRRENPAIDGPRDKTVCFMLSDGEKFAVDRLAFCVNLTRSAVLAKIVDAFVTAVEPGKDGKCGEKELLDYLSACREAVKKRGELGTEFVESLKGPMK